MKMKRKTKDLISKIVSVALVVATVVGIGALIGHFESNKADDNGRVEINPSYEIGGLTSYGKYEETKKSIYTKEAFKCDGLNIEPQFDSTITYQVFFYDNLGNFVSSTSSMEGYYTDEIPTGSSYARIVITPKWDKDTKDDDRKINIFQVSKYCKQLTVKVNAEQRLTSEKFVDSLSSFTKIELTNLGQGVYNMEKGEVTSDTTGWYWVCPVDVSDYNLIVIKLNSNELNSVTTSDMKFPDRAYFNYYNNTTKEDLTKTLSYTIQAVVDDCTYVSLDVSDISSFVWSMGVNSVSVCECYVK